MFALNSNSFLSVSIHFKATHITISIFKQAWIATFSVFKQIHITITYFKQARIATSNYLSMLRWLFLIESKPGLFAISNSKQVRMFLFFKYDISNTKAKASLDCNI